MMPLTLVEFYAEYVIERIAGNEHEKHHLESMGVIRGAGVCLIAVLMDTYVIKIGSVKIALSKDLVKRIIVRKV